MLINLSNHPWSTWDETQKRVVESSYGRVVDMPFPVVDPEADISEITILARNFLDQSIQLFASASESNNAVHVCGEHCFVFQFVTMAREKGVTCVCSTTPRQVHTSGHAKFSVFRFIQLRQYY